MSVSGKQRLLMKTVKQCGKRRSYILMAGLAVLCFQNREKIFFTFQLVDQFFP